ncbi:MAG: 7TM diverse intracellular signaling domain-containing protein [Alcanivoracaceae bacterium]|nr:7TM diverse intracellular signaling domain-containing protein [Alcanivoracaceae bacterium]
MFWLDSMRRCLLLLCVVIFSGLMASTGVAREMDFTRLSAGEVAFTGHRSEAPSVQLSWQPVSLPFSAAPEQTRGQFWFRLDLDGVPEQHRSALYIQHHVFDIELFLNGTRLGGTTRADGLESTGWNQPYFQRIAAPLWRDSGNQLLISVRAGEPNAMLSPLIFADEAALAEVHRAKTFQQVTIAEWSVIACLIMGGFTFFVWLQRRDDSLYLHFALLCLSWSVVMFYLASSFSPLPHGTWLRFSYYCVDLAGFFLFMFLYHLMQLNAPWPRRLAILAVIGSGVALFSMDIRHHALVITVVHGVHLALVLYLLAIGAVRALRSHVRGILWFMPGFLLIAVLVGHDINAFWSAAQVPGGLPEGTLMQYGFGVLLVLIFAYLIRTFVKALDESEHLNTQLEARVRDVSASLERSYAENRALELHATAQQERQNIYRDLHDDVGAKLVSIVHADVSQRQTELAREALMSLREAVSQSRYEYRQLLPLMTTMVAEMEVRLVGADMAFRCDGVDTLPDQDIDPAIGYQLSRILREVTSNIIKHVGHGLVKLDCVMEQGKLRLTVTDDGPGMPDQSEWRGAGLGNIRYRAAEIGAQVSWQGRLPNGTLFHLSLALPEG